MFKKVNEVFDFIYNQHVHKAKIEDLNSILLKYNNFHKDLVYIHTTGTNGKGSTSKLINDILINNDYKTGLFTSPHMLVANDRIRINNNFISDNDLIYYANLFYEDIINYKLNFFQIYVLIALRYFYDNKCDICVIEVGIGGLFDATNVIDGIISIITNVNFDHKDTLGNNLSEIAYQKAGIIKDNNIVITTVNEKEAINVIKNVSTNKHSKLYKIDSVNSKLFNNGLKFNFENKDYYLNSLAKYQINNAIIAIKTSKLLRSEYNYNISDESIDLALSNFMWLGRYEQISKNPNVIVDGAHNIAGIKALINNNSSNMVVIFSVLADKDYKEMLDMLIDHYIEVVFCEFEFNRALSISALSDYNIEKFEKFSDAIKYYENKYPNLDILVCGSLYFISEIRKYFS